MPNYNITSFFYMLVVLFLNEKIIMHSLFKKWKKNTHF